jgi:hypothetical protein
VRCKQVERKCRAPHGGQYNRDQHNPYPRPACPTIDLYSAPFLVYPQPPTNLSPRCFSGTITRRLTFGTNPREGRDPPPRPIRRTAPTPEGPTNSPSMRRRVCKSCSLYSLCFAFLAHPSVSPVHAVHPPWCVAKEGLSTSVLC